MSGAAAHSNIDILNGFLAHLRNEKQYSPLTAENYARDIRRLTELAGTTPLDELKSHHIRRYVAQLHGQGLGGKTLARMLSAWRSYFNYLIRDHQYKNNPCIGLRAPKSARNLPHALSPDEAVRMVELPTGDDLLAIRDKAMFELFYSSGLRLAELVGLDLEPMLSDINAGEVRVTGKGNKTRIVPLGSHAITALQAWLITRPTLAKNSGALFINRNGGRLSARSVQLRMKAWASNKASPVRYIHTCYAILSLPMFSSPAVICVPCRKCLAMRAFPPRRFILISIFNI